LKAKPFSHRIVTPGRNRVLIRSHNAGFILPS
jgi:hypothetical protein